MPPIPITILAGSDLRPSVARGPTAGLHPLATYKGAELHVGGRPLAALLFERLAAVPQLGPVRIAGPRDVYAPLVPAAELVDTDGSVGVNLRAAIEHHTRAGPGPMGLIATDVLPSAGDLEALCQAFATAGASALWFPLVRRPDERESLGAFAWKPSYLIRPGPGEPAVRVLPGHVAFFEPAALRLPLLYRLLDSGYRARNRSVSAKKSAMLRRILLGLIGTDLRLLARLRAPSRTFSVIRHGLAVARQLRADRLTLAQLEASVSKIVVRQSVQERLGTDAVRLPLVDDLWLAQDIDTREEELTLEQREP